MGHFQVEYNGKWAAFSTISDDFITKFSSVKKHEKWMLIEYGRLNCMPLKDFKVRKPRSVISMSEAVRAITLNRVRDDALETLTNVDIPVEEANTLIDVYNAWQCELDEDDLDNPYYASYNE
jgi:crotonobetainyl-CoA:carnitine CoA-transferase CaiB-like acyl-CoA transferase